MKRKIHVRPIFIRIISAIDRFLSKIVLVQDHAIRFCKLPCFGASIIIFLTRPFGFVSCCVSVVAILQASIADYLVIDSPFSNSMIS